MLKLYLSKQVGKGGPVDHLIMSVVKLFVTTFSI